LNGLRARPSLPHGWTHGPHLCVDVCVCVCVCVCVRARAVYVCVRENLYLRFLNFDCVSSRATAAGKAHRTQIRKWMGGWSDQGL
jgi:hypothetical protein